MPLVEIEDSELARLKAELADASNWKKVGSAMANGKDTKVDFWKTFKKVYPDTPTELDAAMAYAKPVQDELDAFKKEFSEYKEGVAKERAEREEREKSSNVKSSMDAAHR